MSIRGARAAEAEARVLDVEGVDFIAEGDEASKSAGPDFGHGLHFLLLLIAAYCCCCLRLLACMAESPHEKGHTVGSTNGNASGKITEMETEL